jgi:sugar lactone lactonase YvrE
MTLRLSRPVLAAAAIRAAAVPVYGHGEGVIESLEPLEALVASRIGAATGPQRRAYAALDRRLQKEVEKPFFDEMRKLAAVCAACRRKLADDAELGAALDAALDEAAAYLDGRDEQVDAIVRNLEREKDRAAVARIAGKAAQQLADARVLVKDTARQAGLARSGVTWRRAETTAAALLRKQLGRGAPGQPVAKGAPGTIDTYVGSGAQGNDDVPRPALGASLSNPVDAALGPTGLLHVVDLNNNQIRRLDEDGLVRAVAGTGRLGDTVGPPLESDMHHPSGIAFAPGTDEMWIASWHAARVLRIDAASGNLVYVAGSGELGFSGDGGPAVDAVVDYPSGIAFGADGTAYFCDQGNRRIRTIAPGTTTIRTIAGDGEPRFGGDAGPALLASFNLSNGQSADVDGRICLSPDERWLYVADTDNHRVRRIDLASPERTIVTFLGTGEAASGGDGGPSGAASVHAPVDVECDAEGNLFVCERDGCRVRRVDADDLTVTTVAGVGTRGFTGDHGAAAAAELDLPTGICIDRLRGRLYIADTNNQVIRVVWE